MIKKILCAFIIAIYTTILFAENIVPLSLKTRFQKLNKGSVIELNEIVFPKLKDNSQQYYIIYRKDNQYKMAPQYRTANGLVFFQLENTLEPHTEDINYYIADNNFIKSKQIAKNNLAGLSDTKLDMQKANWYIYSPSEASLSKQNINQDDSLKLNYTGQHSFSSIFIKSPVYNIKNSSKLRIRISQQVVKAPKITTDSLPKTNGKGGFPTPGDVENQLTSMVSEIVFFNNQNKRIASSGWKMYRLEEKFAKVRDLTVYVPKNATKAALVLRFRGKGDIELDLNEITIVESETPFAMEKFNLDINEKITFPQLEIRANDKFTIPEELTIQVSDSVKNLNLDEDILFDGIRNINYAIANSGVLRVGLWDNDTKWKNEFNSHILKRELIDDGYALKISKNGILLLGKDVRGLFYGIQELGERITLNNKEIACADILDYPSQKLRIAHQLLNWDRPSKPNEYYTKWIPYLARHRINAIAFDTRTDWFYLKDKVNQEYWKNIFNLCKKWNIEPIPMGFSFRNTLPIKEGLNWVNAKWAEDELYTLNGEIEVPLKGHADGYFLTNSKTQGFTQLADGTRPTLALTEYDNPFIVTSKDKKTTYTKDVDYIVTGSYNFTAGSNMFSLPSYTLILKKRSGIKRLATGKIKDGEEVLVSYNYVYRQRGFRNEHYSSCISETHAIKESTDAMADLIDILEPKYMHINQDEIVGVGKDGRDLMLMREKGMTPSQIFANLLESFKKVAREKNIKTPLIVWSDNFTPTHAGWSLNYNGPFYLYNVKNYINVKDYLVTVWGGIETANDLLENNYNVIIATLEDKREIYENLLYANHQRETLGKSRIQGVQLSSWERPDNVNYLHIKDFARLAWNPSPYFRVIKDKSVIRVYDPYATTVSAVIDEKVQNPTKVNEDKSYWQLWNVGSIVDFNIENTDNINAFIKNDLHYQKNIIY